MMRGNNSGFEPRPQAPLEQGWRKTIWQNGANKARISARVEQWS
jgi:hypothetical protein